MVRARSHVVTLGGGRGHSQLLSALRRLDCRVTAVVSVADDGGCSGRLREELGMAPPGDLRRCLTTLATRRERADRMEQRLAGDRSVGNLMIARRFLGHRDLQRAIDEIAWWLGVRGRVCATSPGACTLEASFAGGQLVTGETSIAAAMGKLRELRVRAPLGANPAALTAIATADAILLGPGSFYTSTLAAALTPGVQEALVSSAAPKLLVPNVAPEDQKTKGWTDADYLGAFEHELPGLGAALLDERAARRMHDERHDPELLAEALERALAIPFRQRMASTRTPRHAA